jgi:glycosyltransferase involved in cell wall biosynthesis
MKILFLFPYPHGTAPSQRFRFEQYLNFLHEQGVHYDLQSFLSTNTWQILYKSGHNWAKIWGILSGFWRRFLILFQIPRYDFVFIHREASPIGLPIFEWIIAKIFRKKIIFDFDDAIWLPNTSENNAWVAGIKFHQKTAWICGWSYKVSAGNSYLCEYASRYCKNVVLNPTTIDTDNLHNRVRNQTQNQEKLVIGWTGTHSTMQYLNELTPILSDLEQKYEFQFLVISNQKPDFALNSLQYLPWNKDTEIDDLLKMHVGVMPLVSDKWAKGKCGFKALQYMSLGIPALVSPVGVNTEIVDQGLNGYICDTPEDWAKYLVELLLNPERRAELGQEARKKIEEKYSVKSNKTNFLKLFDPIR